MRIGIIGGGASGMMAALTASEHPDREILLFERQSRMGRKLLASGNGRCNLSNRKLSLENYHGEAPDFCAPALEEFGVEETLDYFRSLGLLTVTEESGRVYPASDSANSVADVLRLHLEQRENVQLHTGCEITGLRRSKQGFVLQGEEQTFSVDRVIVAAGGLAGGKLGGTESGYRLLASLGHSRSKLYPALVQLRTDPTFVRSLKGVRCEAVYRYGKEQGRGEIQFTDYGVSGPAMFQLSRKVSLHREGELLHLDLLGEVSRWELLTLLEHRCSTLPGLKCEDLLTGMLQNRLGRTVLRACGLSLERLCGSLSEKERKAVADGVKDFRIPVLGTMGMDNAQVTAGGMRTEEFNAETLESKLCPGLYATGEVLDIDGDCGGYNLQWAWASGRLAGQLRGNK